MILVQECGIGLAVLRSVIEIPEMLAIGRDFLSREEEIEAFKPTLFSQESG